MHPFLNGLSACASLIAGALFLKFWRDSHDRLFLWFALAFVMFAVHWSAVGLLPARAEARHLYFLPRLLGFMLIVVAIVDKNRRRSQL